MQQQRVEYWQQIEQVRVEDLVFIDEAGVNLAMTRLSARAFKGQQAYSTRPNNRGKNQTMLGAIALTGVISALTTPVALLSIGNQSLPETEPCPDLR